MFFENTTLNPRIHTTCINQALEYFFCISKTPQKKHKIAIPMKWNKPPIGWFKLNTDGASFRNPRKAGAGGLIRDLCRNWVKGFSRSIGLTSSVIAEFWALRNGLQLTIQLEIQNIKVELDARVIVDLINSTTVANRAYSSLLNDCRSLLGRLHQV